MLNKILFKKDLKRLELLNYPTGKRIIKIAVYRNHSFEITAGVLNAFLSVSDYKANFVYSDYDDSLNFNFQNADIELIWIDTNRYTTNDLRSFLQERANVLRTLTSAPILIAYTGNKKLDLDNLTTDCYSLYVPDYINFLGDLAYDTAKEAFSGTRLSNKACLEMARVLGLKYIPAMLQTPFKAVVVDLDNTLYKGILGEDSIDNLVMNREFQRQLKDLKRNGFFLCIASKNDESDVKNLFEKRQDFELKYDDFATVEINWQSKADNIFKIARTLNISTDAILFIDDNPAEIENVKPTGVQTILADEDICQVIKYYPGLLKLKTSAEDSLRSKDIQANIERAKLARTLSSQAYFAKLGIYLEYHLNDCTQISRVAELFGKTNQFILTYARYSETDVSKFMSDKDKIIATIKMSDNLSDSGVIAILAAHKKNQELYLDELTVSCRALGRRLENVMLPYLFKIAADSLHCLPVIHIFYRKGERNEPALNWLKDLTHDNLKNAGHVIWNIDQHIDLSGLKIKVEND